MIIEILVTDEKSDGFKLNHEYFHSVDCWAKENCPSYSGFDIVDIRDHNYAWDEIACYRFGTIEDTLFFRLRWL